jgi:hypothetical protein
MGYDRDDFSQIEEHDETAINLNRVFSAAERDGVMHINTAGGCLDVTDPEQRGRTFSRMREINSPRKSSEVPPRDEFTLGEWMLAQWWLK